MRGRLDGMYVGNVRGRCVVCMYVSSINFN